MTADSPQANVITLTPAMSVRGVTLHVSREEEIYGEGEEAKSLYKVVAGVIRTCAFDASGRRLIEGFYLPGDPFGFENGDTHTFNAEAVCDAEIIAIPRSALANAADSDRTTALALWNITAEKLSNADQHLIMLGKKSAGERVASFLLHIAERLGGARVDLPMSRTDIADYLGLTIETVSRSISQLERQRTISLDGARHVTFNNVAQLQAAA